MVMINASPIDYGHVLLVPELLHCLPQVLTDTERHRDRHRYIQTNRQTDRQVVLLILLPLLLLLLLCATCHVS